MTPTEKARRIDALVQGPEGRRDLACMIVNREADLEHAQAESASLRESVKRLMTQRDERLARAETDNAKLRESVKRLMTQRDERLARAETDNAKLMELVRGLVYATHPVDRARLIADATELVGELTEVDA